MKEPIKTIRDKLARVPFLPTLLSMLRNLTFAAVNGVISLVCFSYWYLTPPAFCLLPGLISLERSMLGTFGNAESPFSLLVQACSGGAAFLILAGMGVHMLVWSGCVRRGPDKDSRDCPGALR